MTIPIVIVDDEETDRFLLRRMVGKSGLDTKVVEYVAGDRFLNAISDEEAFQAELGEASQPFLVFLDINMPRMNGFEVLAALEARVERGEMTPDLLSVVMFSSSSHPDDQAKALKYSLVKEYVVKPMGEEDLRRLCAPWSEAA